MSTPAFIVFGVFMVWLLGGCAAYQYGDMRVVSVAHDVKKVRLKGDVPCPSADDAERVCHIELSTGEAGATPAATETVNGLVGLLTRFIGI